MSTSEAPPEILLRGKTGDLLPGEIEGPEDEGLPVFEDDFQPTETDFVWDPLRSGSVAWRLEATRTDSGFEEIAPFYRGVRAYGGYTGSYSAAVDYHRGRTTPSIEYLAAVARFTDTDLYWLVTGEEQPETWAPVGEYPEPESPLWARIVGAILLSAFLILLVAI